MLDFGNLSGNESTTLLLTGEADNTVFDIVWPRGTSFCFICLVGAGGTGGAGFSVALGTQKGGGGSGASGGVSCMLIPRFRTAERFKVVLNYSDNSFVSPSFTGNAEYFGSANKGGNGGAGTASAGGSAGSAGSATTFDSRYNYGTFIQSISGVVGVAGSATTTGLSSNAVLFIGAGASGAGCTSAGAQATGGIVNAFANSFSTSIIPGGGIAGGEGGGGLVARAEFRSTGGSGGGSGASVVGGPGGSGGPGSGGGGGGGGTTGGAGGRGGPASAYLVFF